MKVILLDNLLGLLKVLDLRLERFIAEKVLTLHVIESPAPHINSARSDLYSEGGIEPGVSLENPWVWPPKHKEVIINFLI